MVIDSPWDKRREGRSMDRRQFLKDLAVVTAATHCLPDGVKPGETAGETPDLPTSSDRRSTLGAAPDIDGHTLISEFKIDATMWKVYEDLRTREGAITFVSSKEGVRVLRKSAEATFPGADPAYLGLNLKDIGTTGADLLAERLLLSGGDPDPMMVRSAAPPLGSTSSEHSGWKLPWDTIVGTKECFDTMPVFPAGSTRTYHPVQYFPELTNQAARKRFDGLIGGWMPAVRKVVTVSETAYDEIVVFGDVQRATNSSCRRGIARRVSRMARSQKLFTATPTQVSLRGVRTPALNSSTARSQRSLVTGRGC